jgi:L-malate glycosyltransferase
MLPLVKVLILDPDYPRDSNLYGDVFVHTRLKAYPASWMINVIGYNSNLAGPSHYDWDNINVYLSPELEEIEKRILNSDADIILVHFIQRELMRALLDWKKPLIVFFHGIESTGWKRRLFNYTSLGDIPYLWEYIRSNQEQLRELKKFIDSANKRQNVHFVFVSEWLKKACEGDVGITISNKHIIPNSIDTDRFHYKRKDPSMRTKILSIRPFTARNYANDILCEVIIRLSKKPYFNELSFSIYGEGYLFNKLTAKIRKFKNVSLFNYFIPNAQIPAIHEQHGTFFCFSRIDSQGVTMCEAMSSGLATFTNRVAAIPEFVEDGISGFLSSSVEEIVETMDALWQSPDIFIKISENGSRQIAKKCSLSTVIPKEVELIQQLTNQ